MPQATNPLAELKSSVELGLGIGLPLQAGCLTGCLIHSNIEHAVVYYYHEIHKQLCFMYSASIVPWGLRKGGEKRKERIFAIETLWLQ